MSITAVPLKPVKRRVLVYLWLGIAFAVIAAAALAFQTPIDPNAGFLTRNAAAKGVQQTPSGLQYLVLTPGHGGHPTDEDVALVNYQGKLTDGTVFDQSQQPTPMPVSGVVPGFSEALKLMSAGAKYRVWIKPALGYGDRVSGPIPAKSILVFDIELLDFKSRQFIQEMQARQQMMQQQGGAGPGGLPPGALPPGAGGGPNAGMVPPGAPAQPGR